MSWISEYTPAQDTCLKATFLPPVGIGINRGVRIAVDSLRPILPFCGLPQPYTSPFTLLMAITWVSPQEMLRMIGRSGTCSGRSRLYWSRLRSTPKTPVFEVPTAYTAPVSVSRKEKRSAAAAKKKLQLGRMRFGLE